MRAQQTLANAVSCAGVGLHSGQPVTLTLKPATPNTGIVFVNRNGKDGASLAASVEHLVATELCTAISDNGFQVQTIEHVLAALAGLVFAARLNTATPKAGAGFELDVIAACFIGGASAYGGVGRVGGAVIGAMIMGVMNNGMSILGIGIDYQQVIKGLVLLGAVCLDVYNQRR